MKIHQLKTRLVNSNIIEYPHKLLVMDVAIGCHREVMHFIETNLKRSVEDISLVLCTHDDPDHMGGIEALAKITKAGVGVPYASGSTLKKLYNDPSGKIVRFATSMVEATRVRAWKMYLNPNRSKAARQRIGAFEPHVLEHRNQTVLHKLEHYSMKHEEHVPGFDDWQIIHTPGHSWDSCCFFHEASGSLITGDTLLGSGKKGHLVKPSIYANPLHLRRSMHRLKKLSINAVYPGHGSVIQGENLLDHLV